jgi:hypothetical protein
MIQRGWTYAQICQETGLKYGTVSGYAAWAREKGLVAFRSRGRPDLVISKLPPEVAKWLRDISPVGGSVEDTIRAIVVDAYNEEKDSER